MNCLQCFGIAAYDPEDIHYDPKSTKSNCRWDRVDLGNSIIIYTLYPYIHSTVFYISYAPSNVEFVRRTSRLMSLHELKSIPELSKMALFTSARLSVQPVRKEEWDFIIDHVENSK